MSDLKQAFSLDQGWSKSTIPFISCAVSKDALNSCKCNRTQNHSLQCSVINAISMNSEWSLCKHHCAGADTQQIVLRRVRGQMDDVVPGGRKEP